jgi:hypothetical protein
MPNRAYPLRSLVEGRPFSPSLIKALREGMSLRGRGCALVLAQGSRITALASAHQRSGPQSWEITHLFAGSGAESQMPKLLEQVSQVAGSHSCQKVFLRLHREDPLVDVARLSGFFPRVPEVLYRGQPQQGSQAQDPTSNGVTARIREKTRRDDHDLFRLYNMITLPEVRYAIGMTIEQWMSSREEPVGRSKEFVLEGEGSARGWLRTARRFGKGQLEAIVHREDEHALPHMVDFGLDRLRSVKAIYCLVPEYQIGLQRVLADRGFEAISDYITLVKSMTVKAQEEGRVRAAVPLT